MAEVPFEAECPSANMRLSEQAGAEARGVSAPTSPLHHQGSGLGAVTALGVRHHATLAEHCHMGAWARRCSQDFGRGEVSPATLTPSHAETYREAGLPCEQGPLFLCALTPWGMPWSSLPPLLSLRGTAVAPPAPLSVCLSLTVCRVHL